VSPQHPTTLALRAAEQRLAAAARHAFIAEHLPHASAFGPDTEERARRRRWGRDDLERHSFELARAAATFLAWALACVVLS